MKFHINLGVGTARPPKFLFAVFFFTSCLAVSAADAKIVTVDFHKVFFDYYKTVQVGITRSNDLVQFKKNLQAMADDCSAREESLRQAADKAADPIVSADERAKYKKDAENFDLQILLQREAMTNFAIRTRAKFDDEWSRRDQALVDEVRRVLESIAKKQGCSLVVDRSVLNTLGAPIVLNVTGENDLTEAVLKELNSTAPPPPSPAVPPAATNDSAKKLP